MNASLRDACSEAPQPPLRQAWSLYTAGDYFACHEVLEELWRATEGPLRELYRGLIQVVVGLYHARRGNVVGGRQVLARGLVRLEAYPACCLGIDLALLRAGARRYLDWLVAGASDPEPERPVWRWTSEWPGET